MEWRAGDRVIVRGADWRVIDVKAFSDCQALDLEHGSTGAVRTLLVPFDRPRMPPRPRLAAVSRRRWAREVRQVVLASFPYGGLRCCPPAIRLMAYQLEPALAVLRHGATRVLIADGVGLGKTVEAGLVIRELAARDPDARILILCPAALSAQWIREMARLFDVAAVHADASWLRQMARTIPVEVNPWSLSGVHLASIDFVKRPEALRPLEDVRWDLLVVDEAHVATCGSDRRAAVDALAKRSRRVLLLTATPHSGDDDQFRALCALGRAGTIRWSSSAATGRTRRSARRPSAAACFPCASAARNYTCTDASTPTRGACGRCRRGRAAAEPGSWPRCCRSGRSRARRRWRSRCGGGDRCSHRPCGCRCR
jgi:hypothetical protein